MSIAVRMSQTYPLKGRGTGPGMSSHKDGLVRHGKESIRVSKDTESVFQDAE